MAHALDTLKFRPSRSEFRELAARATGSELDCDQVYAEIHAAIQGYPFGVRDPKNPIVMLAGEPEWSSPVVAEVVRLLGGWAVVGEWDAFRGPLRRALESCYESAQRRHRDGTLDTKRLPGCKPELRIEGEDAA